MASDIAYWSKEFGVTGAQLHEVIRSHGTHVENIRAALHSHKGQLSRDKKRAPQLQMFFGDPSAGARIVGAKLKRAVTR